VRRRRHGPGRPRDTGFLWAWGENGSGQLGDGTTTDRQVPTQVSDDIVWFSIDAGSNHTLAGHNLG
jgi:alpha-tubulin suppressor-like RCC1 family protein